MFGIGAVPPAGENRLEIFEETMMATEFELKRVKTLAIGDQAWAAAASIFSDIKRIGAEGPNGSERDQQICRQIDCLVQGELFFRTASGHAEESNDG